MTIDRKALAILMLFPALAACEHGLQRNPQLSNMTLDAETMPEAAVRVPMPAPEPAKALSRADRASLWQNGERGFFGDQRAEKVGDILTIEIQIDDEADLENSSERSRSSSETAGRPTFFGLGTSLTDALPNDLPDNDIVDLSSESEFDGSGSIERSEEINLKVAALIIDELPNGNLVIAGRQEVRVNAELRELRVAGIIRPVDISKRNAIPYEKIAEARISYGGRGQLSKVQQPRYGQDALDVILPY